MLQSGPRQPPRHVHEPSGSHTPVLEQGVSEPPWHSTLQAGPRQPSSQRQAGALPSVGTTQAPFPAQIWPRAMGQVIEQLVPAQPSSHTHAAVLNTHSPWSEQGEFGPPGHTVSQYGPARAVRVPFGHWHIFDPKVYLNQGERLPIPAHICAGVEEQSLCDVQSVLLCAVDLDMFHKIKTRVNSKYTENFVIRILITSPQ